MSKQDEQFMQRALDLAAYGKPTVSPNPMVGCVIVLDGLIIGEGWHQKAGEPHAEVLAIRSVKDQELLKSATAYVTLEPCAHYGKTPPCAELLVKKGLKKVVIGAVDPNPLVAGKGIEILKRAGIEVKTGVLENSCLELNKVFFTHMQKKRPYIVLKWAETADGFVARANYDSKWISNSLSRQMVHKWRTELDAILVGKNTVKYDDPALNARDWPGKNPVRLVVDHQLNLPESLRVFNDERKTVLFYSTKDKMPRSDVESVQLSEEDFLNEMMQYLHSQNIQSVLVEGGADTLQKFIDANLWDEARVFHAPVVFESGISSPQLKEHSLVFEKHIQDRNQTDTLSIYHRRTLSQN